MLHGEHAARREVVHALHASLTSEIVPRPRHGPRCLRTADAAAPTAQRLRRGAARRPAGAGPALAARGIRRARPPARRTCRARRPGRVGYRRTTMLGRSSSGCARHSRASPSAGVSPAPSFRGAASPARASATTSEPGCWRTSNSCGRPPISSCGCTRRSRARLGLAHDPCADAARRTRAPARGAWPTLRRSSRAGCAHGSARRDRDRRRSRPRRPCGGARRPSASSPPRSRCLELDAAAGGRARAAGRRDRRRSSWRSGERPPGIVSSSAVCPRLRAAETELPARLGGDRARSPPTVAAGLGHRRTRPDAGARRRASWNLRRCASSPTDRPDPEWLLGPA